ncbi:13779_t:CDS:2 [Ambispora leptoticha]|uniref:13779_t:CDS:1 n=1 Tax=Ambispora leptoticha TaxID=144679 RepID=A0A9N8VSB8_9GLOM|nr:13779_t:CDS:2 [Ambispora leptoticha]
MSKSGKEVFLISDILQIIFTRLKNRDLFSVILVNRTWCRIGIPILWKAPFGYRPTGYFNKRSYSNKRYAIRTYLLLITEPSLNYLKMIPYLPKNTFLPKDAEETYANLGIIEKPLFDYILYCSTFDYGGMLHAILDYCETLNSLSKRKTAKIIMKILLEMFKSRGLQFKKMRVKYQHHENDISLWASLEYASLYSEIDTLELIRRDIDKRDVLAALIPLCRKIKHLKITINFSPNTLKELITLIRSQTNLTTIKIFGFTDWSIFQKFTRLKLLKIANFSRTPDIGTINNLMGAKCERREQSDTFINGVLDNFANK